jgi:ABC-2 type transport system ATP-binding protein
MSWRVVVARHCYGVARYENLLRMNSATTPSPPGVCVTGLTKTFRSPSGPVPAVRGIDLTIQPGESVALLGPNGAGKSTTIDMLLGLQRPDHGTVEIFGTTPEKAVAAGMVSAVLQTGGVAAYLSVRELLDMVASLYPHPLPVDEVVRLTRIEDLAAGAPTGSPAGRRSGCVSRSG